MIGDDRDRKQHNFPPLFKTLNTSKKFTVGRGFVYLSIGGRDGGR
jgi:hypothetical protein